MAEAAARGVPAKGTARKAAGLILGTAQLGAPYGSVVQTVAPSEREAIALVCTALNEGCGIDTARIYPDSERRVGLALATLRSDVRNSLAIVTKLDPLNEIADARTARVATRQSICASRRALGLERLPVLLLHRAEHRTAWGGAAWDELRILAERGAIGCLGASVQTVGELVDVLSDPDIRHIQLPLNPLDGRWAAAAVQSALAGRRDVVVHVRSVYLQGTLLRDAAAWPRVVDPGPYMSWLDTWSARLGRTRADLCLAYVRAQAWVDGTVIGAESMQQIDENIGLFARPPLTDAERAAMEGDRPAVPDTLVNPALWPRP